MVSIADNTRHIEGVGEGYPSPPVPTPEDITAKQLEFGEALGAALRAEMARRGVTQTELAHMIGLGGGESQVSKLLNGRIGPNGPTLRTLATVCSALDLEIEFRPKRR